MIAAITTTKKSAFSEVSFHSELLKAIDNGYEYDFSLDPYYRLYCHMEPNRVYSVEEYVIKAITCNCGTLYLIQTNTGKKGTMAEFA